MTPRVAADGPADDGRVQPSLKLLQDKRNNRGAQMVNHDKPSIGGTVTRSSIDASPVSTVAENRFDASDRS